MQETQVQSLGCEDPLEEEMASHSSILAWEIPGTEEPGGLQFMESQRAGQNLASKQQQAKCIYVSPNLQIHPTLPSLPHVHVHSLCLHLYSCPYRAGMNGLGHPSV